MSCYALAKRFRFRENIMEKSKLKVVIYHIVISFVGQVLDIGFLFLLPLSILWKIFSFSSGHVGSSFTPINK